MEPTEVRVLEPDIDPVATIVEKDPVPVIAVTPSVLEPLTFK
jgi:hypothetical protein